METAYSTCEIGISRVLYGSDSISHADITYLTDSNQNQLNDAVYKKKTLPV